MGITWEDRPNARWIILTGELDHEGCALVHDEFQKVAEEAASPVVVDLAGVPFVASNGLRLLLETHHQLRDAGRRLLVHNLQPSVRKVFRTTGIFDAIPEFET
ncbi:MAG: STAS domain-containing protein [Planctomycetota bacterium]|jgi:anti-sigma B factor antagonist